MQLETNRSMKYKQVRKKKKRRLGLKLLFSFFVFSALASGTVWWQVENTLNQITTDEPVISEDETRPANYNQEPISLVLIGRDSREGLGLLNTDVLIVAALNPKTKHVTMMSIPRDTGVRIPGYRGYHKINSVYAKGESERRSAERAGKPVTETGTSLLKKTLEDALGIPIHYYAMIDFEGFEKVIDKLGGVEVNVDKSMKYDDPTDGTHIDLEPGLQVLNGDQALDFVRHRKDNRGSKYYSTDFERGARQQQVIKAMVDKMKSFTGISSFFSVMNVAGDHIRTDLSKDQIKGLILDFKSVGSENIVSLETGGYWDRASSHTIIPRENLEKIQLAFQQEMEMEGGSFKSTLRVNAGSSDPTPSAASKSKAVSSPGLKEQAQEEPVDTRPVRKKQANEPADTMAENNEQEPGPVDLPAAEQQPVKQEAGPSGGSTSAPVKSAEPVDEPQPVSQEPVEPSPGANEQSGLLKPPIGGGRTESQPVQPEGDGQG